MLIQTEICVPDIILQMLEHHSSEYLFYQIAKALKHPEAEEFSIAASKLLEISCEA